MSDERQQATTTSAARGAADGSDTAGDFDAEMRASAAMQRRAQRSTDEGPLADMMMAQLFPGQVARPRLGRFVLLGFLGEGGMSSIYSAYDERLDRRVAIKFLRSAAEDVQAQARLLREAQALARLSHPNVVAVHEVWEEAGRVYMAMEHVQGEALSDWQATPRPWREVVEVYRQAGEGLAAAHAADLVHRDFKPHNGVRRGDGVVKVLDFGLARIGDGYERPGGVTVVGDGEDATTLTRTGALLGTPVYMAPEQHEGAPADARSDQFSFCVALWEGLYGQPPFTCSSLAALRGAVLAGRREELRDSRGVPTWVRRVVERGLMRDAAGRHPSMRALLRELERDPAIRRRRVAAGLTAVGVALGGGLVLAELRAPEQCAVAGQDAGARWGEERRAAVHAGTLRAGIPAPEETWARVLPGLEAYAGGLAAARTDACEVHRRGMQSDRLHDRQVACLERRAASFDRLTELLAAGDREAVLNATSAVAGLPGLASCADMEGLAAELPPPDDPEVAVRVVALRQELARAQAEELAGKHLAAEQRAAAVEQAAEGFDYAPLRAEAALRRGSAEMQRRAVGSIARLDGAVWLALTTEQRAVAAEAAALRIYAHLELGERSADVAELVALASSLAARAGAGDWKLRWLLANNTAIAWERRGELTRALEGYKQALRQVPAGDSRFERAATWQNMAPLQVRLGEREAGEQAARAAVAELRALYGPGHPQTASAEAVFADVLLKLGREAEAAAVLAGAIERASADGGAAPLEMLLAAARLALRRGDFAGVLAWCARAAPQLTSADGTRSPWQLPFAATSARVAASRGDAEALAQLDGVDAGVRARNAAFVAIERAELLSLLGRGAEAEALVRAELAGGLAEASVEQAELLLARTLVARGAHEEAAQRLAALLAGESRLAEPGERALALQLLASAEVGAGRPVVAVARAREAVAVLAGFDAASPTLAAAWFTLARVLGAGGPGGEAEAEALARRALAVYLALGTGGERAAAEIEAWSSSMSQETG